MVEYELNAGRGGITFVGSAPDHAEARAGKVFVGQHGRIFEDVLREAGLRRADVNILNVSREVLRGGVFAATPRATLYSEICALRRALGDLSPSVIITLGNEASHAIIPEWPDAPRDEHRGDITRARGIENRRGYSFETPFGAALATVHPAFVSRNWSPWRVLLAHDLRKAKRIAENGHIRPTRDVTIVSTDRDARSALEDLGRFRVLSADIETWGDLSLACVGFAGESGKAYVFPARYLDRVEQLLSQPALTTVWANGIYDLFVLKHREGVDFRARVEDAQVGWHACYPELAGAKEGKKKHRFTRKSLAFLASLAVDDAWWKGDYETEEEFYVYNGKDCCITFDVWEYVQRTIAEVGAAAVYEHERRLIWPCVDMLARGLAVDDRLRQQRFNDLDRSLEEQSSRIAGVVTPFLEENRSRLEEIGKLDLFREMDPTCECCNHGKKKQMACWACAGFASSPSKAEIVARFKHEGKATKADLEARYLPVCHVCGGAPREERWTFNLNSPTQMKILLYEVLRLPKKMRDGKLTADEGALKSLLASLPESA